MPVSLHGDATTGLKLATGIAHRLPMAARRMDIISRTMHVWKQASAPTLRLCPYETCADPKSQKYPAL